MVEVGTFNTKVEADLARTLLESHGIMAFVFDGNMNNVFGGAGLFPVRLAVDDEDEAEARKILAETEA